MECTQGCPGLVRDHQHDYQLVCGDKSAVTHLYFNSFFHFTTRYVSSKRLN